MRDCRIWQYREDGTAQIFPSREAVPPGEGWGDFPFPQRAGDLDSIASELEGRAAKLESAVSAAREALKGEDNGEGPKDQSGGDETNGGSGSEGSNSEQAETGSEAGGSQGPKGQRLLKKGRK
jgi:hypothetical protein